MQMRPGLSRDIVKQSVRNELSHWQGGRCFYCAEMFVNDGGRHHPRRCTFDHIRLERDGGELSLANGVAACRECNWLRGDMPFDEFCLDMGFAPNVRARQTWLRALGKEPASPIG